MKMFHFNNPDYAKKISKPEQIASKQDPENSDTKFREAIFKLLPESFGVKVAKRYVEFYESEGRRVANLYLLDVKDEVSALGIKLTASDADLIQTAKNAANHCLLLKKLSKTQETTFFAFCYLLNERYKICPSKFLNIKNQPNSSVTVTVTNTITKPYNFSNPLTDSVIVTGFINRLCCEYWWRRVLRKTHIRNVEKHAIRFGEVCKNKAIYISDESYGRHTQQKKRNNSVLENCIAVNQTTGQEYTLKELADLSLANPRNRRIELMVRVRGFDEISKELKHISMFYTITCPSKMHAYSSKIDPKTGTLNIFKNNKYNGTTPKEAQDYLVRIWACIRSKLKRKKLDYYGFRVAEAHHDGTPHWHLLIFMHPSNESAITSIIKEYALCEDSNEIGAEKHRFKAEAIDPNKGSATQYIAKYITKALDAHGIDDDLYGKDAKTSSQRVRAWASTWGIRQFQQLGGPPVTIYRELRRLQGQDLEGLLGEIWQAADNHDWHKLIKLLGGPTIERKDYIISIAAQWSDKPNRYEEPTGYQIIGLNYGKIVISTRYYQWKIGYQSDKQKSAHSELKRFRDKDLSIEEVSNGNIGPYMPDSDFEFF